jgi:DNA-binding phage protein
MATFQELIDRSLDGSKRAGLTDTTEIKSLINQVYLQMYMVVRPRVIDAVKTLTQDVGDYSISSDWSITDMQDLRRIKINDSQTAQNYVLEKCMPDYIAFLRQTVSTSGGMMRLFAQDGLDRVSFYPTPSSTTLAMTLTYVQRPALLSSGSDVPADIPVEHHDVIVLGVLARSLRVWNPAYAAQYHQSYMEGLAEYRRWMNRFGGAMPSKVIVKGGRMNLAFHDNSTDYSGMR